MEIVKISSHIIMLFYMQGNIGDKEEKFMAPATNIEDLYAQVHMQKVKELSDKDIK